MEKISLYIADRKVDLDDRSFILFNYTMEDLSNPTIVKNSFSKQITLKGTPTNNEIFGSLYRSDRKTMLGNGNSGIGYDPLRKTPFAIYNEMSEVIESGYVKVDSVSNDSGKIEYKVTLYGGLGSFFYGLSYDDEGNKRTLYGMAWKHYDGSVSGLMETPLRKSELVNSAWAYLKEGTSYMEEHPEEPWDILNFAPCYNGIPADFDAKHVLFNGSIRPFDAVSRRENGVTYVRKSGCTSVLATLSENHTEWEVRNIRPYLQRPVIRLKAIVEAIIIDAKKRGFEVELDSDFFRSSNRIYNRGWVTLPLLKKEDRNADNVIAPILKSSLSPCEYLLGFAKTFGWVFLYNGKKISIITRNTFYDGETIDITGRVDRSELTITPNVAEHKWYQMGGDKVVGEETKKYAENYKRPYGSQRINTGYDFDSEIEPLTKDIPYIGAADVAERNYTFASYYSGTMFAWYKEHPLQFCEEIKFQYFSTDADGNEASKEFTNPVWNIPCVNWNGKSFVDWLPKAQLHEAENKTAAGEHCLLFLDGYYNSPLISYFGTQERVKYYVSDDHPDMEVLNSGTPCWNLDATKYIEIDSLPSFRRTIVNYTMEWGIPVEEFTGEGFDGVLSLYDRYWKAYLSDRYDVDTKVMRCKVNLSGMQVGQALMRNFFFYDNALWVLNKIENHSISTEDLTECEFVKIKDIDNYKNGQKI